MTRPSFLPGRPSRRGFLSGSILGLAALALAPRRAAAQVEPMEPWILPDLPYAYDALEPALDAETMELHHRRHHAAYVAGLNRVLRETGGVQSFPDLFARIPGLDPAVARAVRNHGGGHANHLHFWDSMLPGGAREPAGALAEALARDFGSVGAFRDTFRSAALGVFGSGWAWLIARPDGRLAVTTTPNQDSPLMGSVVAEPGLPLLGVDVWEHAYYLKFRNRRPDYVDAFLGVVNWTVVAERHAAAAAAR